MWKNNPLCLLEINNPTGHIMCCICSKENSISKKCINKIKYRRHTFERKANKFCTLLAQSDLPLDAFALSLPPLSSSCSYRHLLRICFRATAEFIAVSCGKASDRFYWVHWEAEYYLSANQLRVSRCIEKPLAVDTGDLTDIYLRLKKLVNWVCNLGNSF